MIRVSEEKCTGCGICADVCLRAVITMKNGRPNINAIRCVGCAVCVDRCPEGALEDLGDGQRMYFSRPQEKDR